LINRVDLTYSTDADFPMTRPSQDAPLQPGDIVGGRYRVIQAIGDGPLDRLYEAQDVHLHERVIVRVQRRTLAADADQRRKFEDQAKDLRMSESDRSVRVLELSQDSDLGHFAAISNKENLPLTELLSLLTGVDGQEAPPVPRPKSSQDFRFPSSQSQVELEALDPPEKVAARDEASPRFAQPRRPKKLETLELDAPRFGTTTGPRPAMTFTKTRDWGAQLRRAGVLALILGAFGVGTYLYLNRQGQPDTNESSADEEVGSGTVMAPHREVQILFRVTPPKARLRIEGKLAPGHSILVPESDEPFVVRFEARGYQSQSVKVVPNRNRTTTVVLRPKP
jgi:hypothetical protein